MLCWLVMPHALCFCEGGYTGFIFVGGRGRELQTRRISLFFHSYKYSPKNKTNTESVSAQTWNHIKVQTLPCLISRSKMALRYPDYQVFNHLPTDNWLVDCMALSKNKKEKLWNLTHCWEFTWTKLKELRKNMNNRRYTQRRFSNSLNNWKPKIIGWKWKSV